MGESITLEVDHINNDWSDSRRENLQYLCPNCHGQKTVKDHSGAKHMKQWRGTITIRDLPPIPEPQSTSEPEIVLLARREVLRAPYSHDRKHPIGFEWRKRPHLDKRKVVHPSKEELAAMVWQEPVLQIAKRYGVSDQAVVHWLERYKITSKPPRGYWNRRKAGETHEEAILPWVKPTTKPQRRFTDEQVIDIIAKLEAGHKLTHVAHEYGATNHSIANIKYGRSYRHIKRVPFIKVVDEAGLEPAKACDLTA